MKLGRKEAEALTRPDTALRLYEMTDERKQRWCDACEKIIDQLRNSTQGPGEAYCLLKFVQEAFEEIYDIRGAISTSRTDEQH
jgi:hypothetical protein